MTSSNPHWRFESLQIQNLLRSWRVGGLQHANVGHDSVHSHHGTVCPAAPLPLLSCCFPVPQGLVGEVALAHACWGVLH